MLINKTSVVKEGHGRSEGSSMQKVFDVQWLFTTELESLNYRQAKREVGKLHQCMCLCEKPEPRAINGRKTEGL